VEDGTIHLEYCPMEDMLANGMTKALPRPKFERCVKGMGIMAQTTRNGTNGTNDV